MRIVETGFHNILQSFAKQCIQNWRRSATCQCQFVSKRLGRNLLNDYTLCGHVYINRDSGYVAKLQQIEDIQKREQGLRDMCRSILMCNQCKFDRISFDETFTRIDGSDYGTEPPPLEKCQQMLMVNAGIAQCGKQHLLALILDDKKQTLLVGCKSVNQCLRPVRSSYSIFRNCGCFV